MIKPLLLLALFLVLATCLLSGLIWLGMQTFMPDTAEENHKSAENLVVGQSELNPEQKVVPSAAVDSETSERSLTANAGLPDLEGELDGLVADKIKFKKPGGETAFSIKLKDGDLKLVDPNEKELARVTVTEGGKFKLKDSGDEVLGYVTGEFPRFKIKDAAEKETLFEFGRQNDGDWKLKRAEDMEICRIGKRDYGWKIEDGSKNDLGRVKVDGERTSIRDSGGQVRYYTNDFVPSLSVVPFGMPELTRGQAAALSAALMKERK